MSPTQKAISRRIDDDRSLLKLQRPILQECTSNNAISVVDIHHIFEIASIQPIHHGILKMLKISMSERLRYIGMFKTRSHSSSVKPRTYKFVCGKTLDIINRFSQSVKKDTEFAATVNIEIRNLSYKGRCKKVDLIGIFKVKHIDLMDIILSFIFAINDLLCGDESIRCAKVFSWWYADLAM